MDSKTLALRIKEAPSSPGVYTWRDSRGNALYVGKAANIRSRLSNYRKASDTRIQVMITNAATLTWQDTPTDIEALILESQLIKQLKPTYNIVMRDDKQYFYVAITREDFPHISLTHQPVKTAKEKVSSEYIGPFTEGLPLKSTLSVLRTLFPYCTCKQKHHLRCLNAHIGRCLGFCCLKQQNPNDKVRMSNIKLYQKNIKAIKDIITGKRDTLITTLKKQMHALATSGKLEQAIKLQKTIERVSRVFENALINARHQSMATTHDGALDQLVSKLGLPHPPQRIEGYDIANIQGEHATGSMVVFTGGIPDKSEYRKFNIKTVNGANDTAMLREVLSRRLAHTEWPTPYLILIDGGKAQMNIARTMFKSEVRMQNAEKIPIIALTKNERHQPSHVFWKNSSFDIHTSSLVSLPRPLANIITHIDAEAHRFAISHYRTRHRKSLTGK